MAFFYIDPAKPFPDPPNPQPISAGVVYEATAVRVLDNAVVDTNVLQMVPLPARARVVELILACETQGATLAVGDGDDPDRYITSAALAAGAVSRTSRSIGMGYRYATADTIDILFGATPTDGGTVKLTVLYVIE